MLPTEGAMMRTQFLDDDIGTLTRLYAQEAAVASGLPYVHLKQWSTDDSAAAQRPLVARPVGTKFAIRRDRPHGWLDVSERGIAALAADGHDLERNEDLLRVSSFDPATSTLTVHQAEYNDQRRSGLILDFRAAGFPTLREMLRAEYGSVLPPLSDDRMANTLGIAMLIVVEVQGRPAGYCVRRAKKGVAVFQNSWHCTASGAAKWPAVVPHDSLYTAIANDMLAELEEEVGLTDADLTYFMPVAFSREMLRGGKPQLFFVAGTALTPEQLKGRRRNARRLAGALHQVQEVEADSFLRSAARFVDLERDRERFVAQDVSHEASCLLIEAARQLQRRTPV